jgi:hypothetical protein
MRSKYIFIDIDGPLAWGTWNEGKVVIHENEHNEFTIPYPWNQEDATALLKILEQTNAKLVLSSDWREHYSFRQMRYIFDHYGIHWSLVDITTHQPLWNKLSGGSADHIRALQILKWVKDNKVSNWIAIDDLDLGSCFKFMKPRVPKWRHVQVDGDHGDGGRLRDKIEECVEKLNR